MTDSRYPSLGKRDARGRVATRSSADPERVIVVQLGEDRSLASFALEELALLAKSAGAQVERKLFLCVRRPNPATYLRAGQVAGLQEIVADSKPDLIIFGRDLSPGQERNLAKRLGCRVLNKSGLILDIFAQRAQTREGKLQVELAQLHHLRTRLVRGWTHLERQKGGIGMHGPGESQLETDRRLVQNRIRRLESEVDKSRRQREQSRRPRRRTGLLTIALVGYTNAGKSTLFRALCDDSAVYCADKLFATLDPLVRRRQLSGIGDVAFIDTVGFVSGLPHHLIHAFRATLDEVRTADLLLHVIDSSHPNLDDCILNVEETLHTLGAHRIPRIEVYNKADLRHGPNTRIGSESGKPSIAVSAHTGFGVERLVDMLAHHLRQDDLVQGWRLLGSDQHDLRAYLHRIGAIFGERFNDDGSVEALIRTTTRALRRHLGNTPLPPPVGEGAKPPPADTRGRSAATEMPSGRIRTRRHA